MIPSFWDCCYYETLKCFRWRQGGIPWNRGRKKGWLQGQSRWVMSCTHIPPAPVPAKDVLELNGRRDGHCNEENVIDYILYPWMNSLGIACQCSLECPHCSKYSFLLTGFSLAGTEHCTGVSVLPWFGLKQLRRRATEIHHQNMHHPSTWDKSDGMLLRFSNRATSMPVQKALLSVYKR